MERRNQWVLGFFACFFFFSLNKQNIQSSLLLVPQCRPAEVSSTAFSSSWSQRSSHRFSLMARRGPSTPSTERSRLSTRRNVWQVVLPPPSPSRLSASTPEWSSCLMMSMCLRFRLLSQGLQEDSSDQAGGENHHHLPERELLLRRHCESIQGPSVRIQRTPQGGRFFQVPFF